MLTDHGFDNINDILIIINKYMNIIKEEGYKQEYFNNFVKHYHNQFILMFNRNSFFSSNIYQLLNRNKKYINEEEILHIGKLTEKDYNQDFLKKQLSNIRFEKSFYSVNSKNKVTELDLNGALSKPETKNLDIIILTSS